MNKEERKAIEDMNRFANGIDMSCVTARQMQIILNLIKKLQKENEELGTSNKYTIHLTDEQYNAVTENAQNDINQKWIQKVKDKIEEELPLIIVGGRKNKKTLEYGIKLGRRQALQELIEEREEK